MSRDDERLLATSDDEKEKYQPTLAQLTAKYSIDNPIHHHMMRMFLLFLSSKNDRFVSLLNGAGEIPLEKFVDTCTSIINKSKSSKEGEVSICCSACTTSTTDELNVGDWKKLAIDAFHLLNVDTSTEGSGCTTANESDQNEEGLDYKELNICDNSYVRYLDKKAEHDGQKSLLTTFRAEVKYERDKQLARLASVDFNSGQVAVFISHLQQCGWVARARDGGKGLLHHFDKTALATGEIDYCLSEESSEKTNVSEFHEVFDAIDKIMRPKKGDQSNTDEPTELQEFASRFRKSVYRYVSSIVDPDELEDFQGQYASTEFYSDQFDTKKNGCRGYRHRSPQVSRRLLGQNYIIRGRVKREQEWDLC